MEISILPESPSWIHVSIRQRGTPMPGERRVLIRCEFSDSKSVRIALSPNPLSVGPFGPRSQLPVPAPTRSLAGLIVERRPIATRSARIRQSSFPREVFPGIQDFVRKRRPRTEGLVWPYGRPRFELQRRFSLIPAEAFGRGCGWKTLEETASWTNIPKQEQ